MSEQNENTLTYEETLAYSQNVRRRIVEHYTKDRIPNEVSEVGVVLKALKDMDVNAIEHKRNSIEEGKSESGKLLADAMAEFLKIQKNNNPFALSEPMADRTLPELDINQIGEHTVVPGELDIETSTEEADEFIRRMDIERRKKLEEDD